jgi:hypothetical protein
VNLHSHVDDFFLYIFFSQVTIRLSVWFGVRISNFEGVFDVAGLKHA